ncbi:MAG: PD-(D/E)XK nuclease family protein [Ruminococcus sp.]|nr:PD-(D/E)XK nuclease family protein [Ruminococcus sp.]
MDETDKKFMEFIEKLRGTETGNVVHTIPEVFGIQYKEVYITKWLAYLLRQKDFGWKILNALSGSDIVEENDIKNVYTEYVFKNGRRIDVLIDSKNFLIGIENKIWSGEQENQTSDYKESMENLAPNKECIGIYLHPEQNITKSVFFDNVTYTQLYNKLDEIDLLKYPNSFKKIMLEQFMLYIKECLYMKKGEFPKITENAILYANNIDLIQSAESEFNRVSADVIEWLKYRFENEGYIILNNPCENKEKYIQLAPKEDECKKKWEKIGFHFEILWSSSLVCDKELRIDVHLENNNIDTELQNRFKLDNGMARGDKNPLESESLAGGGFENKTKSEDTFNDILKLLNSERFQKWARIANS